MGTSTGNETEGDGDEEGAGVGDEGEVGLWVGLGDGVASTAIAGAASAITNAEAAVVAKSERVIRGIYLKIDFPGFIK
ncbi:hypothetical protein [Rhodoluna lacicola]|uniref:Uncharacterized protein n=1 Tax=Rhodoluna lacicola TaxID=529884 RepID=A0A060JKS0_9MICO|nr:hypothetical protein [Rhodoluna lacicola]AIC47163.1 hypothetical protein Rhola_00003410 [Rhodoluna lacicola]